MDPFVAALMAAERTAAAAAAGRAQAPPPGPGPGSGPPPGPGTAGRGGLSLPGILHFIQSEWARFEAEKGRWEAERAELQVRGGRGGRRGRMWGGGGVGNDVGV